MRRLDHGPWSQQRSSLAAHHLRAPRPHLRPPPHRLAGAVADPLKQGQYNTLIKSLQEEQQLLKEVESTLAALQTSAAAGGGTGGGSAPHSRAPSSSVVR
jgi:hypothetical protein